jgi:hypothetical protein
LGAQTESDAHPALVNVWLALQASPVRVHCGGGVLSVVTPALHDPVDVACGSAVTLADCPPVGQRAPSVAVQARPPPEAQSLDGPHWLSLKIAMVGFVQPPFTPPHAHPHDGDGDVGIALRVNALLP